MGFVRLLLAISVVIAHSNSIFGIELIGGPMAVETFFMISGFYMTLILKEKYFLHQHAFRLFITNRFLKLYPAYWAVLILTIILSLFASFRLEVYKEWFYTMNIFSMGYIVFVNMGLFFQETLLFMGLDISSGGFYFATNFRQTTPQLQTFLLVPQAWTIGLELFFYLLAPFLVRLRTGVLLAIMSLSLVARFLTYSFGFGTDPWTYRFFPFELAFFIAGILSYKIYKVIERKRVSRNVLKNIFLSFIIITVSFSFIELSTHIKQWIYYGIAFVCIAPMFLLSKKSSFDRIVGDLSYPVYISHILVIFMTILLFQKYPLVMNHIGIFSVIFTVAFSFILLKYIVYPIEFIRKRRLQG